MSTLVLQKASLFHLGSQQHEAHRNMFWNKADSQWVVKGTRLLSLVPPEGKKKLCPPPAAILVLSTLWAGNWHSQSSLALYYQSKILGSSPWWLQEPAQRQPWIISPTINSWHFPGWLPMEKPLPGGTGHSPKAQISQEITDGREQHWEGKRKGKKDGYPSVFTVITSACRLPCLLSSVLGKAVLLQLEHSSCGFQSPCSFCLWRNTAAHCTGGKRLLSLGRGEEKPPLLYLWFSRRKQEENPQAESRAHVKSEGVNFRTTQPFSQHWNPCQALSCWWL